MIRKIKKIIKYIDSTSAVSRFFTYFGLKLSCVLLFAALILAVAAGEYSIHTLQEYHLVTELVNTSYSVLLVSTLGAGIIEDLSRKR